MLLQGSKAVEKNDESTKPLITYKCCQAITNAKKNAVRDYYLDSANRKPAYKYVQEWFL